MWRENSVAGGLKEMGNGHEMLVAETEGKLLEDSRMCLRPG